MLRAFRIDRCDRERLRSCPSQHEWETEQNDEKNCKVRAAGDSSSQLPVQVHFHKTHRSRIRIAAVAFMPEVVNTQTAGILLISSELNHKC